VYHVTDAVKVAVRIIAVTVSYTWLCLSAIWCTTAGGRVLLAARRHWQRAHCQCS
jgi:hypothetical protein